MNPLEHEPARFGLDGGGAFACSIAEGDIHPVIAFGHRNGKQSGLVVLEDGRSGLEAVTEFLAVDRIGADPYVSRRGLRPAKVELEAGLGNLGDRQGRNENQRGGEKPSGASSGKWQRHVVQTTFGRNAVSTA
jgi:hypothetical protein